MMRRGGGGWLVRVGIYIFDVVDQDEMEKVDLSLMFAHGFTHVKRGIEGEWFAQLVTCVLRNLSLA